MRNMRRKMGKAKRLLATLLVFGLLLGQITPAYAVSVSENTVEQNTVSANAVDDQVMPEKAYDGTPSKVINLEAEFVEDTESFYLYWNPLSTENKLLTPDGKVINIGYQVEENGKVVSKDIVSSDGAYSFMRWVGYYSELKPAVGTGVTYRVRGLYYTETEVGDEINYQVISAGEWSELYTCTRKNPVKLSAVTGLGYKISPSAGVNRIYLTWNLLPGVERYRVRIIKSEVPVSGLTKDTWDSFYKRNGDAYNAFRENNPDTNFDASSVLVSDTDCYTEISDSYSYYYFRV